MWRFGREFRKRHLNDFKGLFVELVRIARAAGEWDLVCLATNLRRMGPLIEFRYRRPS